MKIIPQQIYRHFKGKLYQIITTAVHSETGEELVIYQALYGDFKVYARPLESFVSKVDKEKYPEAAQEFRFELQSVPMSGANEEKVRKPEREEAVKVRKPEGEEAGRFRKPEGEEAGRFRKPEGEEAVKDRKPAVNEAEKDAEMAEEEELNLDPLVIQFLDASSYEERLNILAGLHHRITDDMLTTMAIVCDIELPEGNTEERYEGLKNCLLTLEKYECNRLR